MLSVVDKDYDFNQHVKEELRTDIVYILKICWISWDWMPDEIVNMKMDQMWKKQNIR
ncbi:MAG: hypothetical protein ACLVBP_14655 [Ruminococcus sp.]